MNPYILIGIDLVVSALLVLLVLYASLNRERLFASRLKERAESLPEKNEISMIKAEDNSPVESDESWNVGDMTKSAEILKEKGMTVEEIAGRMKVPKGEIELVLALSEMKRMDSSDRYGPPREKVKRGRTASERTKMEKILPTSIRERITLYQEKSKLAS